MVSPDVGDGAIELGLGVLAPLGDLPHEEPHDLLAHRAHAGEQLLHARDASGDGQRRPRAASLIPGAPGRRQGGERLGGVELRQPAEDGALQLAVAIPAHRREDIGAGAGPGADLAVDEVAHVEPRGVDARGLGGRRGEGGRVHARILVRSCDLSGR